LAEADGAQAATGLASLGIVGDSDEDDFARLSHDVERRRTQRRKQQSRLEFRTVLVDGVAITARMRPRGIGCIVPNNGQIPNILKVTQGRLSEGPNSDVEARASKRTARQHDNTVAATKPNLRYVSTGSGGIYTCWWKDEEGMMHSKRFSMSRTDVSGLMLETGQWAGLRERVRRQALNTWNALDVSDQPRLDVPEESTDNEVP
jgi:hypothetical protein